MTGLIRFLQNSVGEIHNSVKTYTTRTLYIYCQGCNDHVPVRVLDVLTRPGKPTEIKCEGCSRVVCFAAGREYLTPRPYKPHPEQIKLLPFGQTIQSLASAVADNPVSNIQSVNASRHIPTGSPSASTANKLSHMYGNRNSTSSDSLHECSEYQNSVFGRSSSHRSSISLPRKPSLSQSKLNMLGLEQCCEKSSTSRNSWSPIFASSYNTDSPTPSIAPGFLSHLSLLSLSDEKALKLDDSAIFVELEKSEDGRVFELSVNRRNSEDSRSSFDLMSGRIGAVGRGDGDSDSTRVSDSDLTNIRGSIISDKRRGKMPMRSNAIHRRAVSRRHSLKIEQEELHEAETLSAKRRNSMTTDFDVDPSDEEIRQAYMIYTEASQQQSQHPESDIQWARVILRRRKNWEHMRYEHPLRGVEYTTSTRPLGQVHPPSLPLLTIPTLPNISPRISGFSLPTPVKEESEGDAMSLRLVEDSTDQSMPKSPVNVFGSPGSSDVRPEKHVSPVVALPSVPPRSGGARLSRSVRTFTAGTDSLATVQPKSKGVKARFRKILRNLTKRVSCFRESHLSLPLPHTQTKPVSITRSIGDVSSLVEPPLHQQPQPQPQPRSSGEIQDVPTSEEPFLMVGNEISALVGGMTSPSIQIQFHARAEDLFAI